MIDPLVLAALVGGGVVGKLAELGYRALADQRPSARRLRQTAAESAELDVSGKITDRLTRENVVAWDTLREERQHWETERKRYNKDIADLRARVSQLQQELATVAELIESLQQDSETPTDESL